MPAQLVYFTFFLLAALLETRQLKQLLSFALLSLQCFTHAIRHRAFVERLVRLDSHFDLVSHADEQETSLCAIYCRLSYQLVEGLRVELFSDRANTGLPRLTFL